MMQRFLVTLALALASTVSFAQQSVTEMREARPLYPATGTWWSAPAGAGRWGVQIEVQQSDRFPSGLLSAAVFSYEGDDLTRQAWYVTSQEYTFNEAWRQEGYIGKLNLNLRRTANGTCLECADGMQDGESMEAEVSDVEITFNTSTTAILRAGDVEHQLVKAEFAANAGGAGTQDFWARPFQLQFQLESSPVISDFGLALNFIDIVEPVLDRSSQTYRDRSGWDVYQFSANGSSFSTTIAGPSSEPIFGTFELFVHPELNEYFLVLNDADESGYQAELQLFPLGRYVVEGRGMAVELPTQDPSVSGFAQVLLVTTPSMRGEQGEVLSYPLNVTADTRF